MIHPDWYYKYFNEVFSCSKGYDAEITHISHITVLKDKRVQEIGSGTGEHARQLLQESIAYLELVDADAHAIQILERRFAREKNIEIRHQDGFGNFHGDPFDVIICMYSIILVAINDMDDLGKRLDTLLQRLKTGGTLFFEIIDYDVCMRVFRDGSQNNVFRRGTDEVNVTSRYSTNHLHFIYDGQLEGEHISYRVSLLKLNKTSLLALLRSKNLSSYGCIDLDQSGRRLLAFTKK